MKKVDKLVRDKLPDILNRKMISFNARVVDNDNEYFEYLKKDLVEHKESKPLYKLFSVLHL